jgi:hypothetical protein
MVAGDVRDSIASPTGNLLLYASRFENKRNHGVMRVPICCYVLSDLCSPDVSEA